MRNLSTEILLIVLGRASTLKTTALYTQSFPVVWFLKDLACSGKSHYARRKLWRPATVNMKLGTEGDQRSTDQQTWQSVYYFFVHWMQGPSESLKCCNSSGPEPNWMLFCNAEQPFSVTASSLTKPKHLDLWWRKQSSKKGHEKWYPCGLEEILDMVWVTAHVRDSPASPNCPIPQ